ncbi:MAG: FitA-like ribbon-helix-helix domain-containing protein [Pseudohongiellaceae bacterium]
MTNITIHNVDKDLEHRLCARAAENGRSVEEEAREILSEAVAGKSLPPRNLAAAIRAEFAPLGGVELELPPREPVRER